MLMSFHDEILNYFLISSKSSFFITKSMSTSSSPPFPTLSLSNSRSSPSVISIYDVECIFLQFYQTTNDWLPSQHIIHSIDHNQPIICVIQYSRISTLIQSVFKNLRGKFPLHIIAIIFSNFPVLIGLITNTLFFSVIIVLLVHFDFSVHISHKRHSLPSLLLLSCSTPLIVHNTQSYILKYNQIPLRNQQNKFGFCLSLDSKLKKVMKSPHPFCSTTGLSSSPLDILFLLLAHVDTKQQFCILES